MRNVSSDMLQMMNAEETGEALLVLITIEHETLNEPIRVSSDAVDTVSNGNTFQTFPFEFIPPNQQDEGEYFARLRIDGVTREIIQAVRGIQTPADMTIQVVRGSAPNEVEVQWSNFKLRNVTYNMYEVSGQVTLNSYLTEPYPSGRFTPALFPGMY